MEFKKGNKFKTNKLLTMRFTKKILPKGTKVTLVAECNEFSGLFELENHNREFIYFSDLSKD